MRRREFMSLVTATAAWPFAAVAQSKAIARIAVIGSLDQGAINAFKDGLREFGLVEGETIIILGSPASAASPEEVSKSVSNFISQKIDLIIASGAVAGRTAKGATSTHPIVCLTGDLVGAGLVQSLASPGGNVTGISILTAEASAKRLELLKLLVPALERVAAFYKVADPTAALSLKPTEAAATKLRLTIFAGRATSEMPLLQLWRPGRKPSHSQAILCLI
jgi:putative tryptophan/tyrosine transport system substrate-binding protein